MARKIVILCDIHFGEHDEEVEAVREEIITIGNMKARLVAVCADCDREYIEPLKVLLTEFGQIADSAPPLPSQGKKKESSGGNVPGDFKCPECGRPYQYRGSLRSHAQTKHGMTLEELMAEASPDEQLALGMTDGDKPEVTRAECDQDGCDTVYEWPETRRPTQALGIHKSSKHGIKGKTVGKAKTKKAVA